MLRGASGTELVKVKHRSRLSTWRVIEIPPSIPEPLRSLRFGIEAAVDSHLHPTSHGGH
jgi:hypothetical protein